MLNNNIVSKILGISNIKIDKFEELGNNFNIYISTNPKQHICPRCGNPTMYIHDYRLKRLNI